MRASALIFVLFSFVCLLFAAAKLSFAGNKLWFGGTKLSFAGTKRKRKLPFCGPICASSVAVWGVGCSKKRRRGESRGLNVSNFDLSP